MINTENSELNQQLQKNTQQLLEIIAKRPVGSKKRQNKKPSLVNAEITAMPDRLSLPTESDTQWEVTELRNDIKTMVTCITTILNLKVDAIKKGLR
jgi:hypothetical protein